jgi:hypothetical protein
LALAPATAVLLDIDPTPALIELTTGLTTIMMKRLDPFLDLRSKAQTPNFLEQFFEILITMPVAFFLKKEVIMTEFMADNFAKKIQTMYF